MQRQTGFEVHLQGLKDFCDFILRRDGKLQLAPVVCGRLLIERDAERLFEQPGQSRRKVAAFGDDADFRAAEGVAVQQYSIPLRHCAGFFAQAVLAQLCFDIG